MENSRPGPAVSGVVVTATHSAVRTPWWASWCRSPWRGPRCVSG